MDFYTTTNHHDFYDEEGADNWWSRVYRFSPLR